MLISSSQMPVRSTIFASSFSEQVSLTIYIYIIDLFKHQSLVLVPFPDGYGAAVHFFWPGKGFQLLGMQVFRFPSTFIYNQFMCLSHHDRLSNEKPSAIFRLRGTFTPSNPNTTITAAFSTTPNGQNIFQQQQQSQDVTAVLGLSIEPLSQIAVQVQSLPSALVKPGVDLTRDPTVLAERIVKHLFNYISGFTGGGMMMSPQAMIPMGVIAKWYENFLNKVKAGGVGFLERDD